MTVDATRQCFGSFIDLNAWLAERCRALWAELRHPEHSAFSVAQPFDGYVERMARVSSTCLVSMARNRYSVPCEWVGQMVSTRLYTGHVVIVADDGVMARYERLSNKGDTRYDWQHYIPLVQRKPGALRNGAPFLDLPEPLHEQASLCRHQSGVFLDLRRLRHANGDVVGQDRLIPRNYGASGIGQAIARRVGACKHLIVVNLTPFYSGGALTERMATG